MAKLLTILLCAVLVTGAKCPASPGQGDPSDLTREQPNEQKSSLEQRKPGFERGEAKSVVPQFIYKLPVKLNPDRVAGLQVVFESEAAPPQEAYYIEVFAWSPVEKPGPGPASVSEPKDEPAEVFEKVLLGGGDIFKPLKRGEKASVYVDLPLDKVWLEGKSGRELKLGFDVKPVSPGRPTPKTELKLIDVKPDLAEPN